ncbi:MAG: bifunctional 3-deoxy-7-phosphoheptulonate synthase/chorismate mutase type II [Prevotellaceae bacterium]|jgi:chorismate mutase|nr:bifunctional 3-deoxy-7-phosphoheptulonate synthase/chorismate mutase type II [Prevotellaceae bacterium]
MSKFSDILKNPGKWTVLAGPCSAETEAQVMATAQELAAGGLTDVFRAGVWKPRTQPGSFEGVGEKGLAWLAQARNEFHLPVATEVANARHVEAALQYGIDILWIGARTTTNTFAVQEIADALRGMDTAVLVKNPVAPDLALWAGAVERLLKAGVPAVAAVHRGFSSYQKTPYRNQPLWQIPLSLTQRLPGIPLLCDPSHIGGKREYLPELLQRAADLRYDGWMIETHIRPDEAWSDAAQQITPQALTALLATIVRRADTSSDAGFIDRLQQLRAELDCFDEQLIDMLAQRMKVSEAIGRQKKRSGVAILQPHRRNEMLQQALDKGAAAGFTAGFIEELFELIHQESINRQMRVMKR